MTKFRTLIAAVLMPLVVAGCGGGASSPRAEVSRFVVAYVDQNRNNCCELGMHATVSQVTFARRDPRWAVVRIAATNAQGKPNGTEFLVVRRDTSTWKVVGFGSAALGCPVPGRVRAELAGGAPAGVLDCPPAG